MNEIFSSADILVFSGEDPTAFSVVACDQYTSEPDYWERVENRVGEAPSALRLILPEARLKEADFSESVSAIHRRMEDYLERGLFSVYPDAVFYVERTLRNGRTRRGLIGKFDLEAYDFQAGSKSPIRATEGTVLSRVPPRVKIRENAPLELPHVMLLLNDPARSVIEPLGEKKAGFPQVYAFPLMEDSGRLEGWLLPEGERERVLSALRFPEGDALRFAVGDGNHSLAAARQYYLDLKAQMGESALRHPARYALAELVNLYDNSLEFEAIHRIVTGISPAELREAFEARFPHSEEGGHQVGVAERGEVRTACMTRPTRSLPVGTLQDFLDEYLLSHPEAEIDYIHGEETLKRLSMAPDSVGFLLPPMRKEALFPTVELDGALPRKTFSMGEAWDKRFYFEARRIR